MTEYRSDVFWLRDQQSGDYHAHLGVHSLCGRHQMPAVIAKLLSPGEPVCQKCLERFESIPPELPDRAKKSRRAPSPMRHES
jgi:hypothetical protein